MKRIGENRLIKGSNDGKIKVWQFGDNHERLIIEGYGGCVQSNYVYYANNICILLIDFFSFNLTVLKLGSSLSSQI